MSTTDQKPPRSRALCPACGAGPRGCASVYILSGRHCCSTCSGDHGAQVGGRRGVAGSYARRSPDVHRMTVDQPPDEATEKGPDNA